MVGWRHRGILGNEVGVRGGMVLGGGGESISREADGIECTHF